MNSEGQIKSYDLSKEDEKAQYDDMMERYKKLQEEVDATGLRSKNPVEKIPLGSDQARFFESKGPIFRKMWAKRMARGLSPSLALQLKGLIDNFVINEKSRG